MYLIYLLVPLLIVIPVVIYLYFYIKRMAGFFHLSVDKKTTRMLIKAIAFALGVLAVNVWSISALIILHLVILALLTEIINFIFKKNKVWQKIYRSGMMPVIFMILILSYGFFNMVNVERKDYKIYTDKDIRNEGYRVAMISDLHYGTTLTKEKLAKYCQDIELAEVDVVVLCGDIVDEDTEREEMQEALEVLGKIKSTYGIYFVYGNHDKNLYSRKPHYTEEDLEKELQKNSINILKDEERIINDELVIIGRDDKEILGSNRRKSCSELIENVNLNNFLLLLDHQPCELKEDDEAGIDLLLSGHTHGGQIWPVGLICDTFHINEKNYGYEKLSNLQVIVSSGMSGWGYPIRTEGHSEYLIIDIEKR